MPFSSFIGYLSSHALRFENNFMLYRIPFLSCFKVWSNFMLYRMPFLSCFKVWSNFMLYRMPFSRFLIQYFFYGHRKSIPTLKIYIFQTSITKHGKKRIQNRTRIFQWRYFRKWRVRYVWNHHPMWCHWQQLLLQFHENFQCIHGVFVFRFHSLPNQSYFFQKRFFVFFFFFSLDKTSRILFVFVFVFYLRKIQNNPRIIILMPTLTQHFSPKNKDKNKTLCN